MAKYYKITTVCVSQVDVRLHNCIGTINRETDLPFGAFYPAILSQARLINICLVHGVPINESDVFTEVIL
jgi:hypothetical protein